MDPEAKLRSCGALSALYHDTRQELELLHKQLRVKDNIVTELKARLASYEGLCVTQGDPPQSVVVGPSKSLLESLCQEIFKLKQQRSDVEFRATRHEEEIQRLNGQLQEKDLELESMRCQPEHEKEREIQRLRSALQERERSDATRAVVCTSLAEEADQLRGQLGATVKVCQELLARLKEEKKEGGGEEKEMDRHQKAKEMADSPEVSVVNPKILQLQEENKQLKKRVAYVQSLNSQWQKYDSSREEYIRGLCQQLKESQGPAVVPGVAALSTGMLHQEISRLNGLLEEKMTQCSRLGRDVDDVRRQDQERIQTLEQQVLIYTEDFKSERTDRERAQSQIQDLKEQVYELKQQLHKQGASSSNSSSRDVVPMCRVHIGHRISSRRNKDNAERLLRTADAETPQQAAAASPHWSECPGLSELQCPRCQAKFSDTDTAAYLRHWEECAKL